MTMFQFSNIEKCTNKISKSKTCLEQSDMFQEFFLENSADGDVDENIGRAVDNEEESTET